MIPAPSELPIERLLPHRPPMLMVEHLSLWSPKESSCSFTLHEGALCFENNRFRSIWCVELMAQAVAAGVAYGAIVAEAPRALAGYLLGLEDLSVGDLSALRPGATATIVSNLEVEVPPAAELMARILVDDREVAHARLRVLVGDIPPLPKTGPSQHFDGFHGCSVEGSTIKIGANHPYLAGHFPGAPVLPAIAHLRLIEHIASREFTSISRARFFEPVVPGDELQLSLERDGDEISWTLRRGRRPVSKGTSR